MSALIEEFRWRGLLQDLSEGAEAHLAEAPRAVYIGFDPTASSLHVGTLLPIMALVHAQRHGHHPIPVVGGGTGLIGDPSGKTEERQLLTKELAAANAEGIRAQLERFLDFSSKKNPARMRNNLDWLGEVRMVDFLRDTGKHFRVNDMLRKESVRSRLEKDETGMSYTEFSYLLLQSYDFLELYRRERCTVQMGGSDQWGNITAGIDLIRRVTGESAHGVVLPLLTTSGGAKFGKTETGAVWLDERRTSPYRLYQYWINAADEDALRYLGMFTLLERTEVQRVTEAARAEPGARHAQRAVADDVTRRVHGESGLARARQASAALFGGELSGLSGDEIQDIFADVPSSELGRAELGGEGMPVVDLLVRAALAPSKSEARRAIEGGGIYVNGRRIEQVDARAAAREAIEGRFLVLRKGKKNYALVKLAG
jgi:tyrosyl-tRNA synthetase